jgi:hypothetical protein
MCSTYAQFAKPFLDPDREETRREFQSAKGPDFLSRLRGTLDIPGLDLNVKFDAYGPVDSFPCEAAILLRRAGILGHQVREKAPQMKDATDAIHVSSVVLRALLHTPEFLHGNRSFEALLDMSRLTGSDTLHPSLLPSASHMELHANPNYVSQLIATHYPYPPQEREAIAKSIQASFIELKQQSKTPPTGEAAEALRDWDDLPDRFRESNLEQADHIAVKLRAAGLWFRKRIPGYSFDTNSNRQLDLLVEDLAKSEHDRWVAEKRRQGWVAAASTDPACRNDDLLLHNCLFPWNELPDEMKEFDRDTVRKIPFHLAAGGYEIVKA